MDNYTSVSSECPDSIGLLIYLMQHFPTISYNSTYDKNHRANIKKIIHVKNTVAIAVNIKTSFSFKVYLWRWNQECKVRIAAQPWRLYTVFRSPDKQPNSFISSAYILLSSATSTNTKLPSNPIHFMSPSKELPPPPSSSSFNSSLLFLTPQPNVCPKPGLQSAGAKPSLPRESCFQIPSCPQQGQVLLGWISSSTLVHGCRPDSL